MVYKLTSTMKQIKKLGIFIKTIFDNILRKYPKMSMGLIAVFFFFAASPAFATDMQRQVIEYLSIIIHFLVYFTWVIIGSIGVLLSNDMIMHPDIVPILELFWVIVRNLVNMVFIGVLLYAAFKTLFIRDEGSKVLKESLVPIAAALILVNFSFLAMKVLVDVSSVAAHAAFSLGDVVKLESCQEPKDGEIAKKNCWVVHHYTMNNSHLQKMKKRNCKLPGEEGPELPAEECRNEGDMQDMIFYMPYDAAEHKEKVFGEVEKDTNGKYKSYKPGDKGVLQEIMELNARWENGKKMDPTDLTCTSDITEIPTPLSDEEVKKIKCIDWVENKLKNSGIVIYKKTFTDFAEINSSNIVALIVSQLTPLEELVYRTENAKSISSLLTDTIFSIIISIIIMISFIVMFVVLIVRVVVIWGAFILSPLAVFALKSELSSKISPYIVGLVDMIFIPAKFGVVLSISMALIYHLKYETILKSEASTEFVLQTTMSSSHEFFHLLLLCLIIVFLWFGIFWSMTSKYTEGIVKFAQDNLKAAGGWVGDSAMSANFIPIGRTAGNETITASLKDIFSPKSSSLMTQRKKGEIGAYKNASFAPKINEHINKDLSPAQLASIKTAIGDPLSASAARTVHDHLKANVPEYTGLSPQDKGKAVLEFLNHNKTFDSDIKSGLHQSQIIHNAKNVVGGGVGPWKNETSFNLTRLSGALEKALNNHKDTTTQGVIKQPNIENIYNDNTKIKNLISNSGFLKNVKNDGASVHNGSPLSSYSDQQIIDALNLTDPADPQQIAIYNAIMKHAHDMNPHS